VEPAPRYQRIVVPLDGSEAAERALPLGGELARRFGLPLHLVRVVDGSDLPDLPQAAGIEPVAREIVAAEAMARDYLARVDAYLSKQDLTVTTEVRVGGARRQLLTAIRGGDLVVMAGGGRHGPHETLGSVADGVVGRAPVPVVVVPTHDV
jgi:nucleotide-binding universal stress UspA family protein